MSDLDTNCGCQGCAQGCNCGCQAAGMESSAQGQGHAAICACGDNCKCNPCRCADQA